MFKKLIILSLFFIFIISIINMNINENSNIDVYDDSINIDFLNSIHESSCNNRNLSLAECF